MRKLRRLGPRGHARIARDFRARREALLAVDDAVAAVVAALRRTGELDETYVLFTSDNGFFQGEHRIPKGKYLAYEPSSHVPLLVRGPGIAPGTVSDQLVANTDLAPTILAATGAEAEGPLDGRSLLPFARDPTLRSARAVLHEGLVPATRTATPAARAPPGAPASTTRSAPTATSTSTGAAAGASSTTACSTRRSCLGARRPALRRRAPPARRRPAPAAPLQRGRVPRARARGRAAPQALTRRAGDVPSTAPARSRARTAT